MNYGLNMPQVGYSHEESLVSQAVPRGKSKVITAEIAARIVSMRDTDKLGWTEIANVIKFGRRAVARIYYRVTGYPTPKG